MRIFLIGFMGSGKTKVGKELALLLNFDFTDTDEYIQKKIGRTINDIFDTEGENKFREYEKEVLREISREKNIVIATGGGTPCFFDNMDFMNRQGKTIYLNCPVHFLVHRLVNEKNNRPLIRNKSLPELEQYISQKLAERNPFYYKAHFIIFSDQKEASSLSEKIFALLTTE